MSAMFSATTSSSVYRCARAAMWTSTSLPANISTAADTRMPPGGKSYVSMDETIAHYIRSVEEFAREGGLDTPPSVVRCGIGFRGESASESKNLKLL